MGFMKNFDERSKSIITSVIDMAKSLGMHTLAEGVETAEQVRFLESVGCEKIQGYYYGKPMLMYDLEQHCRDFGIVVENEDDRYLHETVGTTNIISDSPIGLFYDDGKNFIPYYLNDAYIKTLHSIGLKDIDHLDAYMRSPYYVANKKFREFTKKQLTIGQTETISYVDNGQFLRLSIKKLAGIHGKYIHLAQLTNITYNQQEDDSVYQDRLMRNVSLIFREIYYWDSQKDILKVISSSNPIQKQGDEYHGFQHYFKIISHEYVYPEDKELFESFIKQENIYSGAKLNQNGFISGCFRLKYPNGNYRWVDCVVQVIQSSNANDFLIMFKETNLDDLGVRREFGKRLLSNRDYVQFDGEGHGWSMDGELWRNLMHYSRIHYFWKDEKGRFVGASQSFLDALGIKNINDILGKSDVELNWPVDAKAFLEQEEKVLKDGIHIYDQVGHIIINGDYHKILTTKFPIYRFGKIIGLVGYFVDQQEVHQESKRWQNIHHHDPLTGLLNLRGVMEASIDFYTNYIERQEEYLALKIDIPYMQSLRASLGELEADKLIGDIAQLIKRYVAKETIIARVGYCTFLMFTKYQDMHIMRTMLTQLINDIYQLADSEGVPYKLEAYYALVKGSEGGSPEEIIQLLSQRLINEENEHVGQTSYQGDRFIFEKEKFDTFKESVCVIDPESHEIIYANKQALEKAKIHNVTDYRGKKCYQMFNSLNTPCETCYQHHLRRNQIYTYITHSTKTGKDYLVNATLIPYQGKNYQFVMTIDLSKYLDKLHDGKEYLFNEMGINDVVSIVLRTSTPKEGINALLEKVGTLFEADRSYIFESDHNNLYTNTYEWCKQGIEPVIDNLKDQPLESYETFKKAFNKHQPVIIKDMNDIKESDPYGYTSLTKQHIDKLIAVEIQRGGKRKGFIGLDNPHMESFDKACHFLSTVAGFVSGMLKNRDDLNRLSILSKRDTLTGVMNRTAFKIELEHLDTASQTAFIYADINNLKRVNDRYGHDAGDDMIRNAAEVMSDIVGSENVYRIGGDEFLMICVLERRDQVDDILKRMRKKFDTMHVSVALGCVWNDGSWHNFEELIKEADRRMYINKVYAYVGRRRRIKLISI